VTGQSQWGWTQSAAGFAIALLSPVLGAIADAGGRRRLMLALATALTAALTALIWFARPDPAFALYLLVCVGLATVAFEVATVFYNSMLPQVAPPDRVGRISGLGWGLGYAGGLACLGVALVALVQPDPSPLGLDRGQAEHVRATALLVAAWLAVFSLPALLALPDPPGAATRLGGGRAAGTGRDRRAGPRAAALPAPRAVPARAAVLHRRQNTLFAFGAIYAPASSAWASPRSSFRHRMTSRGGWARRASRWCEDRIGLRARTVLIALAP
jgi:UMF1 family MFS transporter